MITKTQILISKLSPYFFPRCVLKERHRETERREVVIASGNNRKGHSCSN